MHICTQEIMLIVMSLDGLIPYLNVLYYVKIKPFFLEMVLK